MVHDSVRYTRIADQAREEEGEEEEDEEEEEVTVYLRQWVTGKQSKQVVQVIQVF